MMIVPLEKAQENLRALVDRALAGEQIVIEAKNNGAVKLAPVKVASLARDPVSGSYRGRGALKGQLRVGPEFFEPLTDEECGVALDPAGK